ncbi:MAG: SGNH/GDSL hydrolase family protein [Oscillospiraceae bacterium]|nr:SGNH/GDSL hydrolase family protein [Oscillospiraceae bacterium]
MNNTKTRSIILIGALTAVVFCAAVWLLGRLTRPKYMSGVLEGAMTADYYDETVPHDVIFIGDCEVYENVSPVAMWREAGVASYIRGSAQQLIWQSYYLLEETFARESPKLVVYNVQAMHYAEPQSEAYNRMTLDGMRLSSHKLAAIRASMLPEEEPLSYLVPLLRYHSRWDELTEEDYDYWLRREPVTVAGYLMRADVKPMRRLPAAPILDDYAIGERCWEYLDKIDALCRAHGATLLLIKSPSIWPHWYDEWDAQFVAYAAEHGLDYINFLPMNDELGIDMQTDTYDAGLHLNIYGAEKLSVCLAHLLRERYGVPDRRGDPVYAADWEKKCAAYDALLAAQLAEIEEYGYLKSWTLGQSHDQ